MVENDQNIPNWIGSIFSSNEDPISKENLILRRKILNYMFKDSIRFLKVLIEFIKGLIARNIDS